VAGKNGNGEGSGPARRGIDDGRFATGPGGGVGASAGRTARSGEKLAKAIAAGEETPAYVLARLTLGEFLVQYEDAAGDMVK
jgi:hypothetical protein